MSDTSTNSGPDGNAAARPQINVLGQYVKDLSFENPQAPKSLRTPGKNPKIQVNFNVAVQTMADDVYEVALSMEANADSEEGVLFKHDLVYAGLFQLKNLPKEVVQPILFIECPALLFPFVRRLVADLSREGGFPPMMIDPIDFASLYRNRLQQEQAATGATQ